MSHLHRPPILRVGSAQKLTQVLLPGTQPCAWGCSGAPGPLPLLSHHPTVLCLDVGPTLPTAARYIWPCSALALCCSTFPHAHGAESVAESGGGSRAAAARCCVGLCQTPTLLRGAAGPPCGLTAPTELQWGHTTAQLSGINTPAQLLCLGVFGATCCSPRSAGLPVVSAAVSAEQWGWGTPITNCWCTHPRARLGARVLALLVSVHCEPSSATPPRQAKGSSPQEGAGAASWGLQPHSYGVSSAARLCPSGHAACSDSSCRDVCK